MGGFKYLKEKEYFLRTDIRTNVIFYEFSNEMKKEYGWISVPLEIGYEVGWHFQINGREYDYFDENKKLKNIKGKYQWFFSIVKEAEASLEKRDKLRKLFI